MTREEVIHILEYERDNDIFCSSYRQRVHVAMNMAIETLKSRPKSEWVPVSERLPDDGKWAIWCSSDGVIGIARFKEDCYNHFYPNETSFDLEDAVAWMPLPEPYK